MLAAAVAVAASLAASAAATGPKHLLFVVVDDLGFDDMGFANGGQINTPTFNYLHDNGVALEQYYVQPSCSPTRATFMTGRKPVHTGINFWIPNSAYGLPLNETTMAEVLNKRGFRSHAVGKWHLGCFKTPYLPTFRGFESFYGFYEGSEDYFSHNFYGNGLDFHQEDRPNCSIASGCSKLLWGAVGPADAPNYWDVYSTNLFAQRAVGIVEQHAAAAGEAGLFLYLAFQGVHEPRQAPDHYVAPYKSTISDSGRQVFAGMLSSVDEGLANVTAALKTAGMFEDTLVVVSTDNGGPTTECSTTGQSNWPLRGSKCTIWDGGTRGTGFFYWSGLPAVASGLRYTGLMHAADWLPTVVAALTDGGAVEPGKTLPLDGVNMWPALLGNLTSPRTHIYYGINEAAQGPALRDVAGVKLIMAGSGGGKGAWSPQQLPNASSVSVTGFGHDAAALRAAPPSPGCLVYSLADDPGEHNNLTSLSPSMAAAVAALEAVAALYAKTRVPQASADPACPKFAGINTTDPSGNPAKYIGPWCD